jgi:hypothetical protein
MGENALATLARRNDAAVGATRDRMAGRDEE